MDSIEQPSDDTDLHKILVILQSESANLVLIWQEFVELYAQNNGDRINLMNRIAPSFFGMLQILMIESMVIRMCRMTDGEGFPNKENLPLRRILRALPASVNEHRQEIEELIDKAESMVDCAREWRNKRLAHLDYHHAVSDDRVKFSIGFTELRESIEAIHAVLDKTNTVVWNTPVSFKVIPLPGTAASLMHMLEKYTSRSQTSE